VTKPTQSIFDIQSCIWKLCCELLDRSSEIVLNESSLSGIQYNNNFLVSVEYLVQDISSLLEGLYQVCDLPKQEHILFYVSSLCTKISTVERLKRATKSLPPLGQATVFEGASAPIKCRVGLNKLQVWVPSPTAAAVSSSSSALSSSSSAPSSSSSSPRIQQQQQQQKENSNSKVGLSQNGSGSSLHLQYPTTALMIRCLTASATLEYLVHCECVITSGVRIDKLVQLSLEDIWVKPDCIVPSPVILHR